MARLRPAGDALTDARKLSRCRIDGVGLDGLDRPAAGARNLRKANRGASCRGEKAKKTESDLSAARTAGEIDRRSWSSLETYIPRLASVAEVPK